MTRHLDRSDKWLNIGSWIWLLVFGALGVGVLLYKPAANTPSASALADAHSSRHSPSDEPQHSNHHSPNDLAQVNNNDRATDSTTEERFVSLSKKNTGKASGTQQLGYATRNIEDLRVGDRVLASNPQISNEERATWAEPDWSDWWHLSLEMPLPESNGPASNEAAYQDPKILHIELLRPDSWVREQLGFVIDEQPDSSRHAPSDEAPDSDPVGCGAAAPNTDRIASWCVSSLDTPYESTDPAFPLVPLSPLRGVYREIALTSAVLDVSELELVDLTVEMDLPEMGAFGTAIITNIQPCPPIQPAGSSPDAQVVTATFKHPPSTTVLDVTFTDDVVSSSSPPTSSPQPLGVTDNHLFWSVDRDDFAPIGEMAIGERVLTYHGDTKRIAQKLPRPGPQLVYNLEVYGEHVYFVGEEGLLAHNSYLDDAVGLLRNSSVRFRNSPLLREVLAIDPIDNVRKWMRTNIRLGNRKSVQALLDGDHVLPKDPVRSALAGLGLHKGHAAFDETISFINSNKNLRLMTSNLNSAKRDLSILSWVRQGGLADSVDSRYLMRTAEIQRANAIQIRVILRKHGIRTNRSFLGEFTRQISDLEKLLN